MTLDQRKKDFRTAAFARRKVAFANQRAGVCDSLSQVLSKYRGVPIAGFMPINTEIDPRAAMAVASQYGPVGVPVITAEKTPLKFACWTPDTQMVDGAFKAKIPFELHWMVPEIVIVPLVAFDRQGGRLGYGGGFYDRTLERLRAGMGRGKRVLAIGFAFSAQEAENLPLEPTDQPLDMIVTELGIINVSR